MTVTPETTSTQTSWPTRGSGGEGLGDWRLSIRCVRDTAPRTTSHTYCQDEEDAHIAVDRLRPGVGLEAVIHCRDRQGDWHFTIGWQFNREGWGHPIGPEVCSSYYGYWDGAEWGWTI